MFRGKRILAHLDVLPDIGFWVDHAHVRLVGAAIDENSVVQLEKAILGIILSFSKPVVSTRANAVLAGGWTYGRVRSGHCALGERDDEELLVVSCRDRRVSK